MNKNTYPFRKIEKKWQNYWNTNRTFKAEIDTSKKKYYILEMFPYPSGNLHMGHVRNYTIGDIVSRFKKLQGYNILHPMGWDSFGLPAENAAIKEESAPGKWTNNNIANLKKQLVKFGFSYDWSKEISSCDPNYYGKEQEIFLTFLTNNLIYRKSSYVNWDPKEKTVLANEQVIDGRGWRSGEIVEKKKLNQWFVKISDFSEELLQEMKSLENWPSKVKHMQKNWIGKSHGLEVSFSVTINNEQKKLNIFTTRPETIFGATFCGISIDHLISRELSKENILIKEFINHCSRLGTSNESLSKAEKIGIDTGLKVTNPLLDKDLPLYITNFVIMDYGTGAIFGCPAHDQRDLEFAKKYELDITTVISKENGSIPVITDTAYAEDGYMVNSGFLNGLKIRDARPVIEQLIERKNIGRIVTKYKLRDWGISRQRYWGCPIPIVHCTYCGTVPVPKNLLPIKLPKDFNSKNNTNLSYYKEWIKTECPKCKKDATRETDTLDTFFASSWYFMRFCSPNSIKPFNEEETNYWLPVTNI